MKTGIIGLPQVGKSSLFRILTKAHLAPGHSNPREAHVGVAKVPDERLDKLAEMYHPKKTTHASVEYLDLGAIGQEALKESAYLGHLRQVDAVCHVVRAFEDDAIPHVGPIDPLRDIKNVEFDLMVSDLGQIEKRLERVEKDLKKMKSPDLEKEFELLQRAKSHLETERPLRELEMTPEDKKRFRGFMFLSEKPILYVLNISESADLGRDLENAVAKYGVDQLIREPAEHSSAGRAPVPTPPQKNAGATAICGKVEAELSEMSDTDAAEFLGSYGLKESGLARLINKTYSLLGLISFLTAGEDECRAWTIPVNTRAVNAAGAIHSDLEKHFIRAETIRWDQLLEAGSEANARAKGILRLEGKDYIVQDGDVMHIRHSG
ncbi:MAG TPA: redox-regulated ATPase YchF [Terriglobales bacterium]|jgi:GTP-binding protein YchF|nr:redox-regulated ATPase YchF [Terriglobales bacterium]